MLTKCSKHFRRTKATLLPCHPEGPIGQRTSSRCPPSGRTRATRLKPRPRAAEDGLRLEGDKTDGVAILLARYRWLALPARKSSCGRNPVAFSPSPLVLTRRFRFSSNPSYK